jgi:hypothetical protein
MEEIVILTTAIWVTCITWVVLDVRGRATNPVFWPFPILVIGPLRFIIYDVVRDLVEERR